jgi:hypothetical protein
MKRAFPLLMLLLLPTLLPMAAGQECTAQGNVAIFMAGLYKLNPVDPLNPSRPAWFQPLSL